MTSNKFSFSFHCLFVTKARFLRMKGPKRLFGQNRGSIAPALPRFSLFEEPKNAL